MGECGRGGERKGGEERKHIAQLNQLKKDLVPGEASSAQEVEQWLHWTRNWDCHMATLDSSCFWVNRKRRKLSGSEINPDCCEEPEQGGKEEFFWDTDHCGYLFNPVIKDNEKTTAILSKQNSSDSEPSGMIVWVMWRLKMTTYKGTMQVQKLERHKFSSRTVGQYTAPLNLSSGQWNSV